MRPSVATKHTSCYAIISYHDDAALVAINVLAIMLLLAIMSLSAIMLLSAVMMMLR